jgi:hypothetical protein
MFDSLKYPLAGESGYGNLYPLQVDHIVNESAAWGQFWIMAIIFALFLVFAIYRYGVKKDSVPVFMSATGIIAFFNEGNYDILVHLTQPANSISPVFWTGGQPMGLGFMVGYWGVFTLMTYLAYRSLSKGLTKKKIWKLWGIIALACLIIEIPGVQMGVYIYQGEQTLRIFGYPAYNLWINATGWLLSGLLIVIMDPILKGWKRWLLSVLPCCGFAICWGICDIPVVCALNIANLPVWSMYLLMLVSLALSLLLMRMMISMFAVDSSKRWTIPWEIYKQ